LDQEHKPAGQTASVVLPAPTAWPFVFAIGTALIFSGLLTNVSLSLLGFVLWIFGAVGWFRQVLPHEHHEEIPVAVEPRQSSLPLRQWSDWGWRSMSARLATAENLP
jgi:hypothetical protein